jgi:hypothetical protein
MGTFDGQQPRNVAGLGEQSPPLAVLRAADLVWL